MKTILISSSLLYFETFFTLFYTLPQIAKTQDTAIIYAATSVGDLIDRILILKIKQENINNFCKRNNIDKELQLLQDILQTRIQPFDQLKELSAQLLQVNKNLWALEDAVRLKEQQQCFDNEFITIVNSILTNNDERAYLKHTINILCNSHIIEEKSYKYKEHYIKQPYSPATPYTISAPLSLGDLVDRITILLIKSELIKDPAKITHIIAEYKILIKTLKEAIEPNSTLDFLLQDLLQVNRSNWYNFDRIREKKQLKEFDEEFIKLARAAYQINDHRCDLKKQINIFYGSLLVEEKCYTTYGIVTLQ
jgi:hypothetical protein